MRSLAYQDSKGRKTFRSIPDDKPDAHAKYGVLVGPPEFDNLPEGVAVRLTNELFHRGIITYDDARRNRNGLTAALMAALKVDVEEIMVAYQEL